MLELLLKFMSLSFRDQLHRKEFLETTKSDLFYCKELNISRKSIIYGAIKQSLVAFGKDGKKPIYAFCLFFGMFLAVESFLPFGSLFFIFVVLPFMFSGFTSAIYLSGKTVSRVLKMSFLNTFLSLALMLIFWQEQSIQCLGCFRAGNLMMSLGYGPASAAIVLLMFSGLVWSFSALLRYAIYSRRPLFGAISMLNLVAQASIFLPQIVFTNYLSPLTFNAPGVVNFINSAYSPLVYFGIFGYSALSGFLLLTAKLRRESQLKLA